jgi:RNA-dependent RNA polymerase
MIMCANGIPEQLMMDIFQESIAEINGLKGRVMSQSMTKEDVNLINTCSDVSPSLDLLISSPSTT